MTDTGTTEPTTHEAQAVAPSEFQSNTEIDGLKAEIGKLRQDLAGSRQKSDKETGELRQQLEEAQEDLKKALSKFEEAAKKPKATLVPPPPPPPDEDTTTPLPANQAPTTAKRKGWTKVW
jgi:multidrug resistance efflux pump